MRAVREVDPGERGRAYDAARAYADADAAEKNAADAEGDGKNTADGKDGDGKDAADAVAVEQRDYRAEVPRFVRMWAEHQERWPGPQAHATVDRTADPEGSFRSDGGFYLSPERNAEAADAIGRIRATEPAVSADLRTAERENACGARLEGFDCRIKGDDRLKEKVAEGLATGSPDATPTELLRQIPDAIRYTFCVQPGSYTMGYYDITARLRSCGYEMYQSRNSWTNQEYKGVNTRWITQEGLRFEVQFHTPDSFHAKHHVTHDSYERLRNPITSRPELRELHAFQREVSSRVRCPEGATGIPDFNKEGL
jgi:hypothetical protein